MKAERLDGFLLSCHRSQFDDLREAVTESCRWAVDQVCPGFHLRFDFEVFEGRFQDEDGRPIWELLTKESNAHPSAIKRSSQRGQTLIPARSNAHPSILNAQG